MFMTRARSARGLDFNLQFFAEPDDKGGGGGGDGDGKTGDEKTYPEKVVRELRAEAKARREELDRFKAESDAKTKEAVASILKSLGIDPDPNVEAEKQIATAKAKADEAQKKADAKLLRAEVRVVSAELGVADPEDVLKLADLSGVKIDEDGNVTGLKEAVEALLKAKPYLKSGTKAPVNKGGVPPSGSGNGPVDYLKLSEEARKNGDGRLALRYKNMHYAQGGQ